MNEHLTISAVSARSGIAKEVLRKWETRYGFPAPDREISGVRMYPAAQTQRLVLIKRLLDDGMRPGKIVSLDEEGLERLLKMRAPPPARSFFSETSDLTERVVAWLQSHDPGLLRAELERQLAQRGLRNFAMQAMPAMNQAIGQAWSQGTLAIRHEHLYTETVQTIVRQAIATHAVPAGPPRILLTTPIGELHTLGLLIVEAVLSLEGASCISLGAQMPLQEIAAAGQAYRANIVGLSFGAAFPRKKILPVLRQLRALCPSETDVWAGGSGVLNLAKTPRGVFITPTLNDALQALQRFHLRRAKRTDPSS